MGELYVPEGYTRVTPYLTVNDARYLLEFLVTVFEAQVIDRIEKPDGKLRHASVRIGDSHIELSDANDQWRPTPGALHIYVPDVDRTYQLALEYGAQSLHEPERMDYGERTCAVEDLVGNTWYIATYIPVT